MAEKTTKKNTKGTKKVAEKKTTKKVTTKAAPKKEVKKVTPKKEEKKVAPVKEVKKEEKVVTKKENKMKGKVKEVYDKVIANKPFAISLCIILVLTVALVITACHKVIPKTKDGKQVLATLKGKTITADDLYLELKDQGGTSALINMIDKYIVSKEVKFTKENEEYIQNIVDSWKEQAEQNGMTLVELIGRYGLTIEDEKDFFNYLKENYSVSLAVEKFIGDQASEKDLKEYYKDNFSDELTVRHILISVDDSESDALAKAKKLIKELDGTDKKKLEKKFIELAKDNSDDTGTYANGGLLENFVKKDVVSEFFEAANALKDGEYSKEPVKTSYGYHIIYKVSSTPLKSFKELKDKVKSEYAKNLLNNDSSLQVSKWDELRKSYKMNIVDSVIKEEYSKTIEEAKKTED